MKLTLLAAIILTTSALKAQTDTLPSGIYNLDKLSTSAQSGKKSMDERTSDLASLKIHASTLEPGKTNHPARALNDLEEVIVVKEGQLKVIINDSSKVLGPGSIVLIEAGDQQSFQNVSDKPVTYYVFAFKTNMPVNIARGKQAGGSLMKDWNELVVKNNDKGESRPVFNKPTSMFERFDIHLTALNPGFESHPPHTHRAEEIMFVMKGNTTVKIAETYGNAGVGDIILLRPNILHNIKNTGTEQCWYVAMQWHTLKD